MMTGSIHFSDYRSWPLWFVAIFVGVIFLGLEILSFIVPLLFGGASKIPVKGKHLDEFSSLDKSFIFINKCLTCLFVYHCLAITPFVTTIEWDMGKITAYNTLGSLIGFYVFYDFFYTLFHQALHIRSLYPLIHKHHHRQKAPSRGNLDAINVHPFEFFVGEYLHLLTVSVVPCHIITVCLFVIVGGILASLNHTRFDINIPYIYCVKVHDVHHRLPESNYGQYTMLWDRIFGSYRAYNNTSSIVNNKDD